MIVVSSKFDDQCSIHSLLLLDCEGAMRISIR